MWQASIQTSALEASLKFIRNAIGQFLPRRGEWALFLAFSILYSIFIQPASSMQRSRMDTILAWSHQRTVAIDRYHENTYYDKSRYQGHYYSDKAPGMAFLGWPAYELIRRLLSLQGDEIRDPLLAMYLSHFLAAFTVAVPSALMVTLVYRLGRWLTGNHWRALIALVSLGLAGMTFPFATVFMGHNTATFFSLLAFALAFAVRRRELGDGWLALSGFLAGLGGVTDYPNLLFAFLLVVYLLMWLQGHRLVRGLLVYVVGGVPMALVLAGYNWAVFGGPLHWSYHYQVSPWREMHQVGLAGVTTLDPQLLLTLLFDRRGLLPLYPVLLLVPLGWWDWYRSQRWRPEWAFSLLVPIAYLLANGAFFGGLGGLASGPRYVIPCLPFLAFALAQLHRRALPLLLLLGGVTIAITFLITLTGPMAPGWELNPLFEYWWPRLLHGQLPWTEPWVRFGLPYRWVLPGLLGVAVIALVAWAAREGIRWRGRELPPWLGTTLIWLLLVVYVAAAFPVNLRYPLQLPAPYLTHKPSVETTTGR